MINIQTQKNALTSNKQHKIARVYNVWLVNSKQNYQSYDELQLILIHLHINSMFKQYQIRPAKTHKSKSPSRLIRSPAFMKKCEEGIPKINHKAIPLHHTYFTHQLQISNSPNLTEHDWEFWGCANTQYYIPQKRRSDSSEGPRRTYSPSQHLLRKYIKRRPSLICVKRSYDLQIEKLSKIHETHIQQDMHEKTIRKIKQKQYVRTPCSNRSKKTNTTQGTHSQQEILQFNNNLVLAFNKIQVPTGNQHAKRQANILQRKKRQSQF